MSKLRQTLLPIKLSESKERLTSLAGLVLVEENSWVRLSMLTKSEVILYTPRRLIASWNFPIFSKLISNQGCQEVVMRRVTISTFRGIPDKPE